jgi:hypothetical protein
MSDRAAWLEEWCPHCYAAPGARCRLFRYPRRRRDLSAHLHYARGWRERPCPKCNAEPGETCLTPSGRVATAAHTARLLPARYELAGPDAVWAELERRGATIAVVPFHGRAGAGGEVGRITLSRLTGDELVDVERWTGRDELAYALEAPMWGRYGSFGGQPAIEGTVIWTTEDRRVVISGTRARQPFDEVVP